MAQENVLVVWSNYYGELAEKQLALCCDLLDKSSCKYVVETVTAGAYELPAVMRFFEKNQPFTAYLPLGLLLKGSTDHYEFIWEHLKACFIQFSMDGLLFGNGVVSAQTMDTLRARVDNNERNVEAVQAIEYLIRMKHRLQTMS